MPGGKDVVDQRDEHPVPFIWIGGRKTSSDQKDRTREKQKKKDARTVAHELDSNVV
jgi:hypothetical protein